MTADVLARPHDDEARWRLARELAARQDPRGRFIELQLTIARVRREGDVSAATWGGWWQEAEELRRTHGAGWLPRLPDFADTPIFIRGFVEQVSVDAPAFIRDADALFAVAPIRRVHLRGVTDARSLFASPHLARMIALDFNGNALADAGAVDLAGSPHVTRVVWLDLTGNRIARAGLDAILGSLQLRTLRYCRFAANLVPTPEEAYGVEDGVVSTSATDESLAAEARFGHIPWLHAPSLHPHAYPPEPDDLLGPST